MAGLEPQDQAIGSGPEYDYPTTGKEEPVPVVADEKVEDDPNAPKVPGEQSEELSDKQITEEEKLEREEAGEWSEDMAQNEPQPGEGEDLLPEERETLPSDRG